MKDADRTIERLLAGLRDAEPPGGMERRILEALDGMGARQTGASASLWRPATAFLVACAVVLIVAIVVPQHRRAPSEPGHATRPDLRQATRTEVITHEAPRVSRRTTTRVSVRRPHDAPEEETEAASFPAPPLPLTEQERLLLRLAHRSDPENLAILNADLQAVQTARATEQFQQFFEIDATEMRSQSE